MHLFALVRTSRQLIVRKHIGSFPDNVGRLLLLILPQEKYGCSIHCIMHRTHLHLNVNFSLSKGFSFLMMVSVFGPALGIKEIDKSRCASNSNCTYLLGVPF